MRYGFCHSPHVDGVPHRASFDTLRDVFGRNPMVRKTLDAALMFPNATTIDFDIAYNMYDAARSAGFGVDTNLVNLPAWATGGVPAYVAGLGTPASCSTLYRLLTPYIGDAAARTVIERFYPSANTTPDDPARCAAALVASFRAAVETLGGDFKLPTPDELLAFANAWFERYQNERSRTWCYDDPIRETGWHLYGEQPEVDKLSYPRPWVINAKSSPIAAITPISLEAVQYMGEKFGEAFPESEMFVFNNEPDIRLYFPPIAIDGVNTDGKGPDTFAAYRQCQRAFAKGVTIGAKRASFYGSLPIIGGPEVAYAPTIDDRFHPTDIGFDVLTCHAYADNTLDGSYEHLKILNKAAQSRRVPSAVTEFLTWGRNAEWLKHVLGMGLSSLRAIFFLTGDAFVQGFIDASRKGVPATTLTVDGQAVADVIAQTSGRRRAVKV